MILANTICYYRGAHREEGLEASREALNLSPGDTKAYSVGGGTTEE